MQRMPERRRLIREEMRRRWYRSPWRWIPQPIIAYVLGGLYMWWIDVPEPWFRALGAVIVVAAYLFARPPIEHAWRTRMRPKVEAEVDRRIASGETHKKDPNDFLDEIDYEP